MDQFAEVLDRLEVTLADFDDIFFLEARLDEVLGRPASGTQLEVATQKFQEQRQVAILEGLQVTRFLRRGQSVSALRDERGRFIGAEGAQRISAELERRGRR